MNYGNQIRRHGRIGNTDLPKELAPEELSRWSLGWPVFYGVNNAINFIQISLLSIWAAEKVISNGDWQKMAS